MQEIPPGLSLGMLQELHILTRDGRMNQDSGRKLKQVRHLYQFIEPLLREIQADHPAIKLVDHGAGKSYLGFIIADLFFRQLGGDAHIYSIEARQELVAKSRDLAQRLGFSCMSFLGLTVTESMDSNALPRTVDIVTALHACDTATDDAIHMGLTSGAEIIVCAPCCQHELAPQLETRNTPLAGLLKYGLLKQRQADLFTDAARGLLLEAQGYEVLMIEFVSTEHTAKNLMIAAVRSGRVDRKAAAEQYDKLAEIAGYSHQRLKEALRE